VKEDGSVTIVVVEDQRDEAVRSPLRAVVVEELDREQALPGDPAADPRVHEGRARPSFTTPAHLSRIFTGLKNINLSIFDALVSALGAHEELQLVRRHFSRRVFQLALAAGAESETVASSEDPQKRPHLHAVPNEANGTATPGSTATSTGPGAATLTSMILRKPCERSLFVAALVALAVALSSTGQHPAGQPRAAGQHLGPPVIISGRRPTPPGADQHPGQPANTPPANTSGRRPTPWVAGQHRG